MHSVVHQVVKRFVHLHFAAILVPRFGRRLGAFGD